MQLVSQSLPPARISVRYHATATCHRGGRITSPKRPRQKSKGSWKKPLDMSDGNLRKPVGHFIETRIRLYNCRLQNARTFYFYDFLGILQAIWLCYNIKPTPLQADQKPLSVDMENAEKQKPTSSVC